MATVYIVTQGCYSDYGIETAFTTKELADRYVAVHNHGKEDDGYGCRVEEIELDAWDQTEISRDLFEVALVAETGDEWPDQDYSNKPRYPRTYRVVTQPQLRTPECPALVQRGYKIGACYGLPERIVPTHVIGRSYISHKHARKIAADYRTRLLWERSEGMRDQNFKWIAPTEEATWRPDE